MNTEPSVFTRIINREIPSEILFESENVIVIKTITPHAPVHVMAIPKKPYRDLTELLVAGEKDLLWELFEAILEVARNSGIAETGYKVSMNTGENAGQSVFHLHIHLLGGKRLQE